MFCYGKLRGKRMYWVPSLWQGTSFLTHILVPLCSGCIVCFCVLGVCYFLIMELSEGFSSQFYLVKLSDSWLLLNVILFSRAQKNPNHSSSSFFLLSILNCIQNLSLGSGDVAQLVKCLPSMLKSLDSVPSATKTSGAGLWSQLLGGRVKMIRRSKSLQVQGQPRIPTNLSEFF